MSLGKIITIFFIVLLAFTNFFCYQWGKQQAKKVEAVRICDKTDLQVEVEAATKACDGKVAKFAEVGFNGEPQFTCK